ncbi:hypothetical protein COCNU_scaffold000927G000010 [Cocos nucifera]|nr:hypothetical protein [Cocos nucifera]
MLVRMRCFGVYHAGTIRESVHQAPSLDRANLDSSDKLKVYRAPPLSDLLKEQTLFNLGLSLHDLTEMDAQATKMLTKGLFIRKRKGKVQEDSSKSAKISVSISKVLASTATTSEVNVGTEIAPTIEVDTASRMSDHQMLAHIKRVHRQEVEAQKAQEDLRVEVRHLKERVDEVEHLIKEKAVDIESLQDVLHKKEFTSAELKAALALEEERRKEAKNRVTELETQMTKSISEAMT